MSERVVIDFFIGAASKGKRYIEANSLNEVFNKEDMTFVTKREPIIQLISDGKVAYRVNPKQNIYYFAGSIKYFQQKTT